MKKSTFRSYFSNMRKENAKDARPSRLCVESLEERQLLSITDVGALIAADVNEAAQYSSTNVESDLVVDVASAIAAEESVETTPEITFSTQDPTLGKRINATLSEAGDVSYAWYYGTSEDDMTAIANATNKYYYPGYAQVGSYLKVVATYTSGELEGQSVEATTANIVTRAVGALNLSTTTPRVGNTILAYTNPADATLNFQWYRVSDSGETTAIDGAIDASYTVLSDDVGYVLMAQATGAGGYTGESSASTSAPVESPLSISTTTPIWGRRVQASLTVADPNATYQWYCSVDGQEDSWEAIDGAVNSYYYPTRNDLGKSLRVVVSYAASTNSDANSGESYEIAAVETSSVARALGAVSIRGDSDNLGVGAVLNASISQTGVTAEYQWYRVDADGNETAIDGATSASYITTTADRDCYIKVVATGTGLFSGASEASTVGSVVVNELTFSNDVPMIGTRVTTTLTPSGSSVTYQWYSVDSEGNETPINNATKSSYIPSASLIGRNLKVVATYKSGETVTATTEGVVSSRVTSARISTPVPYVGKELVAYSTPAAATVAWQWYRVDSDGNETAIVGATAKTYAIQTADVGLYVVAKATGIGGYIGTASASTKVVAVENVPIVLSTYAPLLGTKIISTLTPGDSNAAYQWYRSYGDLSDGLWEAIDGATESSYTPVFDDVDCALRVVATYQTGDYASLTASVNTGAVSEIDLLTSDALAEETLDVLAFALL